MRKMNENPSVGLRSDRRIFWRFSHSLFRLGFAGGEEAGVVEFLTHQAWRRPVLFFLPMAKSVPLFTWLAFNFAGKGSPLRICGVDTDSLRANAPVPGKRGWPWLESRFWKHAGQRFDFWRPDREHLRALLNGAPPTGFFLIPFTWLSDNPGLEFPALYDREILEDVFEEAAEKPLAYFFSYQVPGDVWRGPEYPLWQKRWLALWKMELANPPASDSLDLSGTKFPEILEGYEERCRTGVLAGAPPVVEAK